MEWIKEHLKSIIAGIMALDIVFGITGQLYWFLPSPLNYMAWPVVLIALALLYRKLNNSKK